MTKTLVGTPDPDEPEDPFGEGSHVADAYAFTGLTRSWPSTSEPWSGEYDCSTQGHLLAFPVLHINSATGTVMGVCNHCNEPISVRYSSVSVNLQ